MVIYLIVFFLVVSLATVAMHHQITHQVYGEHTNYLYWLKFAHAKLMARDRVYIFSQKRLLEDDARLISTSAYGGINTPDEYGRERSKLLLSDLSPNTKLYLDNTGVKYFYTRHVFNFSEPRLYFLDKRGYALWLIAGMCE